MIELAIKHTIAFLYLFAGSISDIKRREVADWANYGLIAIAFASNLVFSLVSSDWGFIINSLIGFGVFFLLALVMFYTGQWGGGDAKMLMGIGALYGIGLRPGENSFILSFFIASLLAGAVYGILWSVGTAFRNLRSFLKEYNKTGGKGPVRNMRIMVIVLVVLSLLSLLLPVMPQVKLTLVSFSAVVYITFYAWLVIKAVEKSCMLRTVGPSKLTEGDWIAKQIWVKRRKKMSLLGHLRIRDKEHADERIEEDSRLRIFRIDERMLAGAIRRRITKIRKKAQRGDEGIVGDVCKQLYFDSFSRLHSLFTYRGFRNSDRFGQYRGLVKQLLSAPSKGSFAMSLKKLKAFNPKLAKDRTYFRERYFYDMDEEYIAGPGDLGILMWQIRKLEKLKVRNIVVKDGIPFVPSFFLGWIAAFLFGDIVNIMGFFY
jgi:Flp pilus assembly protein protease CpaA